MKLNTMKRPWWSTRLCMTDANKLLFKNEALVSVWAWEAFESIILGKKKLLLSTVLWFCFMKHTEWKTYNFSVTVYTVTISPSLKIIPLRTLASHPQATRKSKKELFPPLFKHPLIFHSSMIFQELSIKMDKIHCDFVLVICFLLPRTRITPSKSVTEP